MTRPQTTVKAPRQLTRLAAWFDNDSAPAASGANVHTIDWLRVAPFLGIHLGCLAVIWVGWSPVAVAVALALYALRMFAITAFYHRYFSHRAFRTSRAVQFAFAVLGATAVQRGPLWWASQHRHHHAHADDEQDAHSPRRHGFAWSHFGWFMSREHFATRHELVTDLARYPELRFLDRFDALVPTLFAAALYGAGEAFAHWLPSLNTNGPQMLVWGFAISTVALYHATFTVNSLAHTVGRRRYATRDDSRNNWWLALLTFGEGWHNNHHHFPGSARQGFYWWEIDLTYYGLRLLSAMGLAWDLKPVPVALLNARRIGRDTERKHG
jgi:stearoyl-CoA desaturase (Delta-9 desaturase)